MKVCDGDAALARRPDVDIGKCNLVMQISVQPSWLPLLCVRIRAGNEGLQSFHHHEEDPYLGLLQVESGTSAFTFKNLCPNFMSTYRV